MKLKLKLKLFKASILFLILGLSLNSIGQNRYHIDETAIYDEDGFLQEHALSHSTILLYDKLNWYGQIAFRYLNDYRNGVNGIVFDTLENGQLMYESHWKDGVLDGEVKKWYESGQIEYERVYRKGVIHGLSRHWYENGQLKYEENYKDGEHDGLQREWFMYGTPKIVSNYSENHLIDFKEWYANGNLKLEYYE